MKIAFVRHGDIIDPAHFTTPLTEKGREQMYGIARRLSSLGVQWQKIFTSEYERSLQSAIILHRELNVLVVEEPTLNEIDHPKASASEALAIILATKRNIIVVSHGFPIQAMTKALGHPDGVCDRGEMIVMESRQ